MINPFFLVLFLITTSILLLCLPFFLIFKIVAEILFRRFPPKKFLELLQKQNKLATLEDISPHITDKILAAEDHSFFYHKGFNRGQIKKSLKENLIHRRRVGGSTITQQLAKNLYLPFHKLYIRKIIEIFLTVKLEENLSKEEILTLYLNLISLGNNIYGVKDASMFYFDVTPDKITLEQSYLFVSMLRGDYANNPLIFPENFKKSVAKTLDGFISWEKIDKKEYNLVLNYYTDEKIQEIGLKHRNIVDLENIKNQKILLHNPVVKKLKENIRKESY